MKKVGYKKITNAKLRISILRFHTQANSIHTHNHLLGSLFPQICKQRNNRSNFPYFRVVYIALRARYIHEISISLRLSNEQNNISQTLKKSIAKYVNTAAQVLHGKAIRSGLYTSELTRQENHENRLAKIHPA